MLVEIDIDRAGSVTWGKRAGRGRWRVEDEGDGRRWRGKKGRNHDKNQEPYCYY